jgi:DNA-binding YbaB/EbfC family protein
MSNQMMQAMQQLQLMQQKMAEAQAALETKTLTEEAGSGMVRVTMNGHGRITRLEIDPSVIDAGDKESLEDLLISAINRATERAKEMASQDVADATRGLMPNIPGLGF